MKISHECVVNVSRLFEVALSFSIENAITRIDELVMVEQLGKNLRNNIAHGLAGIDTFGKTNCLIVIYLFFLITATKWDFNKG
ncbi:DUF4209 domain-containing protein [Clostridium sp. WILCCON 0269]|uniref:DUF4209 domain-containing protein n=1 Tax=Candidatus Clostridium eludens TaxID=3381663 RepID=A0ABW8SKE7_9CLOT